MSAARDFCRKQVHRLSNVPLYRPATPEDAKEWLERLMRVCQSDEHAALVMTEFIETVTGSQNPIADFVAIARRTEQQDKPPAGCDRCAIGPDLNTGEMRWAAHVAVESHGATGAGRCGCSRGEWLTAKDGERLAVALAKPERRKGLARVLADDPKMRAAGEDR